MQTRVLFIRIVSDKIKTLFAKKIVRFFFTIFHEKKVYDNNKKYHSYLSYVIYSLEFIRILSVYLIFCK